jgi:DNA-binding CsgD family transcriptional regulator
MDADFTQLTDTEKKICRMLKQGLTTTQIPERLGKSNQSIRHHLSDIYAKSGMKNRSELVQALQAQPT